MDTPEETAAPAAEETATTTVEAPRRSRARVIGLAALAVALVAVVVVGWRVRRKVSIISEATAEIEAELADLDPVERAAVLAQLARGTVLDVRAGLGR